MIHKLIRKCERAEKEGSLLTKMLDFELNAEFTRNEEFMKTYKILKEIDFAESKSLALLYEYMRKDDEEFQMQSQEAAKDYKMGHLDPTRQKAILSESKNFKGKKTKRSKRAD